MTSPQSLADELSHLRARVLALREALAEALVGQREVIDLVLITLLTGGHALLEGAPGLGKTTLVRALARGLDLSFARIQCTPDLMPGDVLGARILELSEDGSRHFRFHDGPIFTQVLLADEINRATPRTQSALLEAMAEQQVTIHGETRALPRPFLLVATQNPIEMEGTYPLPEAQLDRFSFRVLLGLPAAKDLLKVLRQGGAAREEGSSPALSGQEVLRLQALVREVPVSDRILELIVATVRATHPGAAEAPAEIKALVRHGASPRAALALLEGAKAKALLGGHLSPEPEDLAALVAPALGHRLVLGFEAAASGRSPEDLARLAFASALANRPH